MNRLLKFHRVIISGFLAVAVNQYPLWGLTTSGPEKTPVASSCACLPAACACPPTSGCEHNAHGVKEQKPKKLFSVCRPDPKEQKAPVPFSGIREIPVLTPHSENISHLPSFTCLHKLPIDLTSQQYPAPPDKPPQNSSV